MADLLHLSCRLFCCHVSRRVWWLLFFLIPVPVYAWEGVVVRVVDGDTILAAPTSAASPQHITMSVRLYGIDAPEKGQQGGQASAAALASLVNPGDVVDVLPMKSDAYDRVVGMVMCRGRVLNLEQVKAGQAWVYDRYCRATLCQEWKKSEQEAQVQRRGLWREENPVQPWVWRKKSKQPA